MAKSGFGKKEKQLLFRRRYKIILIYRKVEGIYLRGLSTHEISVVSSLEDGAEVNERRY